jgi:hypothetical protein
MKDVEREYAVATISRDTMIEALKKDPSLLTKKNLNQADLDRLNENLSSTYLIRIFAEFETGLRAFWKTQRSRKPSIPVRDMIDSVSSKRNVEDVIRIDAHIVRKYRNSLVHDEDAEAEFVEIGTARKFLCKFFGRLPETW